MTKELTSTDTAKVIAEAIVEILGEEEDLHSKVPSSIVVIASDVTYQFDEDDEQPVADLEYILNVGNSTSAVLIFKDGGGHTAVYAINKHGETDYTYLV